MPVRRRTSSAPKKAVSNPRRASAARQQAVKAAPATKDPTVYAEKDPTPYHKAFANWIVRHVGYNPDAAPTKRAAFLAGVSIATAARPAFMESDYLEKWREQTGTAKRGPKRADEVEDEPQGPGRARSTRSNNSAKTRRVQEEVDEFDSEDEEIDEDEELDEDDADMVDEDNEFEEDDDSDDEEFDDEFEEEEAPKPARRATARRGSTAVKAAPAKRAPAKATGRRSKSDDEFIF